MHRIELSRPVAALVKSMVLFAGVHNVILIVQAVWFDNIELLNVFLLLDLDTFFPGYPVGATGAVISLVLYISVYSVFYMQSKEDTR